MLVHERDNAAERTVRHAVHLHVASPRFGEREQLTEKCVASQLAAKPCEVARGCLVGVAVTSECTTKTNGRSTCSSGRQSWRELHGSGDHGGV